MKISVIVATNRPGQGLKILFNGLSEQIFNKNKFELIIIDDFITDRKKECKKYSKEFDIPNFLYLRPKPHYWRSNTSISNSRNTGLIYAKGKLILFIDDYIWMPPKLLNRHWSIYKKGYCMVGRINFVKYVQDQFDNIGKLPIIKSDTRGPYDMENCGGGWFYTCNASAPLEKIIEVNGFDEEFDLARETDIGLGLMLERVGCKFRYRTCKHCTAYHMDHTLVDIEMKNKNLIRPRYNTVTYQDLRSRGKIDSNSNEIQLVLREKYRTMYDGSWGLHEDRRRRVLSYANIVNGIKIFDLKNERKKIDNWV